MSPASRNTLKWTERVDLGTFRFFIRRKLEQIWGQFEAAISA